MKRWMIGVAAFLLSTSALAQVIQRPRDSNTNKSAGVGYAVDCSVDFIGPAHGELCVEISTVTGSDSVLFAYNGFDASWASVSVDFSALTADTMVRINSAGTAFVDSLLSDDGSLVGIRADGSATANAFTFGASTTADAQVYFDGANFTVDLDGAAGNDFDIDLGATAIVQIEEIATNNQFLLDLTNATGAGQNALEVQIDVINELSSDVINFFLADLNDTEFDTAGGSTVNFFSVEAFTPDSNVDYNGLNIAAITGDSGTEVALPIGAGWDYGLSILDDGSATLSNITLGDSRTADAQIYFDGINLVLDVDATAANGIHLIIPSSSSSEVVLGNTIAANQIDIRAINTTSAGVDLYDFLVTGINATNGSDIVNVVHLDWNETDWATATETLNMLHFDPILIDAGGSAAMHRAIYQEGSGDTDWVVGAEFDASVVLNTYRQDFDGPCLRWATAGTDMVEDVADGSVNYALCTGGTLNLFTYRMELAATSPFLSSVTGQGLDIESSGADNAGLEIVVGEAATDGTADTSFYIRGQSPAMYMRVNITLASVSGTDELLIGWHSQQAFIADAIWSNFLDTYAVHHINDNAGNLTIETDVNGVGIGSDENAVQAAFADAATHTFEVQLSTACVASFYTNGIVNAVTNANDACEAGDIMYPFIAYRLTTDVDLEAVINWIEIGEVI